MKATSFYQRLYPALAALKKLKLALEDAGVPYDDDVTLEGLERRIERYIDEADEREDR